MLVLVSPSADPNESAMDMIEAYKRECATMKVRPISKLLEQLAVSETADTFRNVYS